MADEKAETGLGVAVIILQNLVAVAVSSKSRFLRHSPSVHCVSVSFDEYLAAVKKVCSSSWPIG